MTGTSQNRWRRQPLVAASVILGILLGSWDRTPQPSPLLTITRVEPSSGPTYNTIPLMIHGTGFEAGATVALGRLTAAVTSVTPTLITATVPEASQKTPLMSW